MRDWKQYVREQLPPLQLSPEREAEIVAELAQHLETAYEEALVRGASEAEARAAAAGVFKDWRVLESELHRAERIVAPAVQKSVQKKVGEWERKAFKQQKRTGKMLADLVQDLRYGIRTLRNNPGFTFVAVFTLALGIGGTTAIFSVVNGVLLRPLGYVEADRLITLRSFEIGKEGSLARVSQPDFEDYREQNQSVEEMGLLLGWGFNLTGRQVPEKMSGARVSGNFFSVLGNQALLGRTLLPSDDVPGTNNVVLSYAFWQRAFGGDTSVVGSLITLNGRAHTVVGVMPQGFYFPLPSTQLWGTVKGNFSSSSRRGRFLTAVGRLKDGASVEAAQADFETLAARLARDYPDTNKGWSVKVETLKEYIVGDNGSTLWLLLGMVGFVFLIACANVGNLLLAQASSRQKELAVRAALGASRSRILRQWLTEVALLAALGGVAAIVIAQWAIRFLLVFRPAELPRLDEISLDARVFIFALLVSLSAAIFSGILPALQVARADVNGALRDIGRSGGEGRSGRRLQRVLVVSELALAVILLVGGGLLLRSFWSVMSVDPGFRSDRLLTMAVSLMPPKYREITAQKNFVREALNQISALPGVEAVAANSHPPFSDSFALLPFRIEGREIPVGEDPQGGYEVVSPGYFRTMGISLRRGQAFTEQDNEQAPRVLVINQAMADRHFAREDPVGKRIRLTQPGAGDDWHTIVGVVDNVKAFGLDEMVRPTFYAPYRQRKLSWIRWSYYLVRTGSDPASMMESVRSRLQQIDPDQPVYGVATMTGLIGESIAPRRFLMTLVGIFAGVALALAGVGVFGVLAYSVSRQTHEIGIRMALGARPGDILRMVIEHGLGLAFLGVGIGLAAAYYLSGFLASQLFGISTTDPVTFLGVSLLLLAVSALACYIPARRAAKVDPMVALRYE